MCGEARDTRALEQLLGRGEGEFRFRRDLEPNSDPLNLWFSDWCATRRGGCAPTHSYKTEPIVNGKG